ncbi:hypothetical protein A0H76_2433 [Hepatospora eriocheir]|uniref:Zinc-ribbon 15 domain-containing protein n=1 Tax=Hepatospora eriocheir TaxID=1081669 RepID=A0A1X0QJU8_9MICR|nr:hypothetical protein A0H76_2433 [Hepatospora eriocheir]
MCFLCGLQSLLCGTIEFNEDIDKPESYPDEPTKIMCPKCSIYRNATYREKLTVFNLCYLPLCTTRRSIAYLACKSCKFKLGSADYNTCRCGITSSISSNFCGNCGRGKEQFKLETIKGESGEFKKQQVENKEKEIKIVESDEGIKEIIKK